MISRFIKSRRLVLVAALAVALELSLPLWAARAFKVSHDAYMSAVPIAVLAQFLVVALLLYTVESRFALMGRLAARNMQVWQLVAWIALAVPVLIATSIASVAIGDTGNVGVFAPLKALLGMWGIGLISSALMDRRIAGVIPVIGILLPFILSPVEVPGVQIWGFAFEPDTSFGSWFTAIALLVAGVVGQTFWSDRRRR